jgi:hypothetical protein
MNEKLHVLRKNDLQQLLNIFILIKSVFLQNGNRYENFYKIDGCENWIEDEIAKLQKNKIEYEIIANDEEQPKALRAQ